MKIAIYGGSFDPPHKAHIQLARAIGRHFDQVWLMPCFQHRFGKKSASPSVRLNLCYLAVEEEDNIVVSDFEIRNQLCNGTLDCLQRLSQEYPDHKFSFVIGQDNAECIDKWLNHEKLLAQYPAVVIRRGDNYKADSWYCMPPHLYLDLELEPISSTKIRDSIKKGSCDANDFSNYQTYDAVIKQGIYQ